MRLTMDGQPINCPDFRETMDRADKSCETSKLIRLARTSGRREADREIESMKGHLTLALRLLRESIQIIEKGEFEAHELSSIQIGTKLIQDYAGIGVGVCGDVCNKPCGTCGDGEGLARPSNRVNQPINWGMCKRLAARWFGKLFKHSKEA